MVADIRFKPIRESKENGKSIAFFLFENLLLYSIRNKRIHSSAMVFKQEAVKGTDGFPSSQ